MAIQPYPRAYLYKRIVQAKLFIDMNFADDMALSNISREASFSKFHFARLFKAAYGKTPHQYLTSIRIAKALLLLQEGMAVSEVCNMIGFGSLSTFSGLFKRRVGINPSAYLEQQQRLKKEIVQTPLSFMPNCFATRHGWQNSNSKEVKV